MITEKMTIPEIIREYNNACVVLSRQACVGFSYHDEIRRWLMKNHHENQKQFIHLKTIKKAYNGNQYIIHLASHGYKEFKRHGCQYNITLVYRQGNNINCLLPIQIKDGRTIYSVFISHFFDRYRDRVLKDPTLQKTEVITKFFERNSTLSFDAPVDNDKYKSSIRGYCNDGIMFGTSTPDYKIVKTIISSDMFKDSQSIVNSQTFAWKFSEIIRECNGNVTDEYYKKLKELVEQVENPEEREILNIIIDDCRNS